MKTIWKFPFEISDDIEIQMPDIADFLRVAEQSGEPCMWCMVDPQSPNRSVYFKLRATGQPFDGTEGVFLGTFMTNNIFVWHLFLQKEI